MSTVRVQKPQIQPKPVKRPESIALKLIEKRELERNKNKFKPIIFNSLLAVAIGFVSLQMIRGSMLNVDRYVTLNSKFSSLQTLNEKASYQNAVLKKKYKTYTSPEGLESLARDYLNLVGDNEIAIVLKKG